ncbi:MAG: UDP-N-acetylmuramoyl-L-alanine--D-glutamate ligase, partial [Clostridiales bacterium]
MWDEGQNPVYVMGAGRSGVAAATFLAAAGAEVWLQDTKPFADLNQEALRQLAEQGVKLQLGCMADPVGVGAKLVMQSPGIPADQDSLQQARLAGIPVISEIELGFRVTQAKILGITGSNGKTTTTSLLGIILKKAYPDVFVGGNIGLPFIGTAKELKNWAVLELSSFQLETIASFRPKVALILNLTPDHLDRHKTFENYCAAKWRIAQFQQADDWLVLNYDDPLLRKAGEEPQGIRSQILFFSRRVRLNQGVWVDEAGIIQISWQGKSRPVLSVGEIKIPGAHNLENVLAAVAGAFGAGIPIPLIAAGIREFQGVAHRIEPVKKIAGVLYVNDSKATNTDAAIKAMESFQEPILLIAGGLGKGGSYGPMVEKIKEKVKRLVLIGDDG